MADTKISALTNYVKPLTADIVPIVDTAATTTKGITIANLFGAYANTSTVAQSSTFASDIYLAGSNISIPVPLATHSYHCIFDVTKTAAGTAAPVFTLRFGTAGTTGDTARCTFTFGAGTAAVDVGTVEVWAVFRTVGSGTTAVMQGTAQINHALAATGITATGAAGTGTILVTSGGFDSTVANSIMGLSVNGGGSASWTVQSVQAEYKM